MTVQSEQTRGCSEVASFQLSSLIFVQRLWQKLVVLLHKNVNHVQAPVECMSD